MDDAERRARYLERQKLKKRRMRARRYAAGLKADGTPATRVAPTRGDWRDGMRHPRKCVCYDCLWGPKWLGESK